MNDVAGYQLESPGQEGFTIIQYNPEDQYTPHCDGSCDHSVVSKGGRVGTAVLYCEVSSPIQCIVLVMKYGVYDVLGTSNRRCNDLHESRRACETQERSSHLLLVYGTRYAYG
jgi:hypothetical protein